MKKRLAVCLLSLCFVLLCACGNKNAAVLDAKNPVSLTLWHYYVGENQQALERAVSEFNQTIGIEKGVIIDAVPMGSIAELEEAVSASAMGVINARPMPDIFSSYPDKALEIDALGKVSDLNQFFSDEEKQAYVPSFMADGISEDGELLLLPIVKSTELLYVNATQWREFTAASGYAEDALSTWEDIYDTARAYYQWLDGATPDAPWDGKGLIGFDSVANYIIIGNKQQGVDVINAEGKQALLDKAALKRIFTTYYQGISLGYFDAVGKFRSDDIKAGDLVSYVGSSSSAAYFPTWIERDNAQLPIEFLAMPYPAFEGGESYAIQQGAGMCIAKSTPAKELGASLFLKWFTDKAQNIDFAMTTGYLPVQTMTYQAKEFENALSTLREGDESLQNVAAVYEIALYQITGSNTYAAKPFEGSYSVRAALQSTLIAAAEAGRAAALPLMQQGLPEEEILRALDTDARFEDWLAAIRKELTEKEIPFTER